MAYNKANKQDIKDEIIESMSQGQSLKSILDNGNIFLQELLYISG